MSKIRIYETFQAKVIVFWWKVSLNGNLFNGKGFSFWYLSWFVILLLAAQSNSVQLKFNSNTTSDSIFLQWEQHYMTVKGKYAKRFGHRVLHALPFNNDWNFYWMPERILTHNCNASEKKKKCNHVPHFYGHFNDISDIKWYLYHWRTYLLMPSVSVRYPWADECKFQAIEN